VRQAAEQAIKQLEQQHHSGSSPSTPG
jgi:hypothetical protein